MIYNKLEKNNEALADLSKVIELSPDATSAYYNRALIYTEKKDFYPYILKRDSLTLKAIALLSDSKSFRSKLQAAN